MTALHFLSAAAIARRIRSNSLSATDALESALERQQALHPRFNAVVVTDLASGLLDEVERLVRQDTQRWAGMIKKSGMTLNPRIRTHPQSDSVDFCLRLYRRACYLKTFENR